jgi:hypothetical protein
MIKDGEGLRDSRGRASLVVKTTLAKFAAATQTEERVTERLESLYGDTPGYCDRKHKSVFARWAF